MTKLKHFLILAVIGEIHPKALNINDKSQVPDSHINHPHRIVNQAP